MIRKTKLKVLLIALLVLFGLAAFLLIWTNNKEAKSHWYIADLQPFTQWYQINWHGQAVGRASVEFLRNDDVLTIKEADFIEGRVQGELLTFRYQRQLHFTPQKPYRLIGGSYFSEEPELLVEVDFKNNQKLQVVEKRNGNTYLQNFAAIDYTLKDYFKLAQFVESSPKANAEVMAKQINPNNYSLERARYSIQHTPTDAKPYFVVRHHQSNEADTIWLRLDNKGRQKLLLRPSGMEFVASDQRVTLNSSMLEDLYYRSGVVIDKKLGKASKINKLVLSLNQGDIRWFQKHPDVNVTPDRLIHLNPGSRYPAFNDAEKIPARNSRAIDIAKQQVKDLNDPWQKTEHLVDFVYQFLDYRAIPAGFNIDDILDKKRGDCTEYAKLLVELLRAVDIPAREVSGLVYLGDQKQRFGGHVWVEVLLDDHWVAVDPTWNLTQVTSTHIPLSIGEEGAMAALSSELKLEFKLESVSYSN